ncbi:MAG TPA: hypothetical protein VGD78_10160 [Chthoniobacterales bacterium]
MNHTEAEEVKESLQNDSRAPGAETIIQPWGEDDYSVVAKLPNGKINKFNHLAEYYGSWG